MNFKIIREISFSLYMMYDLFTNRKKFEKKMHRLRVDKNRLNWCGKKFKLMDCISIW